MQVRVDPVLQQSPAVFLQETIFPIVWDFSATMSLHDTNSDLDDGMSLVCVEMRFSRIVLRHASSKQSRASFCGCCSCCRAGLLCALATPIRQANGAS